MAYRGLLDTYDTDPLQQLLESLPERGGGNALPTAGLLADRGNAPTPEAWPQRIRAGLETGLDALAPPTVQQGLAVYGGASIPRDATYLGHDDGGAPIMRTADGRTVQAPAAGNLETLGTIFPTAGGGLLGAERGGVMLGAGPRPRAPGAVPMATEGFQPVRPVPQRHLDPAGPDYVPGGRYLQGREDITGQHRAAARIAATQAPGGPPGSLLVSPDTVEPLTRAEGSPVRSNLFRRSAGWQWTQAPEGWADTPALVALESGGKHHYALAADFEHGVEMARYANAPSEPRLRPTGYGDVELGPEVGRINVRGREHPVYQSASVVSRRRAPAVESLLEEPPLPAAYVGGNLDYGAEVLRQRALQLDIPKLPNRIQPDPSSPAFDATPTSELLPGVEQGQMRPMRRSAEGAALPLGDRARPLVEMRDQIADRMAQDLTPQLGHPTQFFYHMRPVYEALRRDGMSHDDALQWIQRDFAPTNAGTSPRTNTTQNLLNTSYLQYRRAQGLPTDADTLRAGQRGYGMIYDTHPRMVQGLLEGTHDIGANPKPYYFGGNIAGDLAYTTADTHAIRAATGTANEIRPGSLPPEMLTPEARARYAADPSSLNWATDVNDSLAAKTEKGARYQPEYPIFHDIYEGVGQRLGIPTADAQSLAWFNYGGRTGLESAPRSIPQLLNERLSITAQALGISPQKAFALYRRGAIPLMGVGGAAALPGLLDEQGAAP